MPCDTRYIQEQQRKEREAALAELQRQIQQGKIILEKAPNGQVRIRNWGETVTAKSGWHESCVLDKIARSGNWLIKAKLKALGIDAKALIEQHAANHRR
jgi:hypothetical protein